MVDLRPTRERRSSSRPGLDLTSFVSWNGRGTSLPSAFGNWSGKASLVA